MSAEQMRSELESFVNQGLAKGWQGWPTTRHSCRFERWQETYDPMSMALASWQGLRKGPLGASSRWAAVESPPCRLETWLR